MNHKSTLSGLLAISLTLTSQFSALTPVLAQETETPAAQSDGVLAQGQTTESPEMAEEPEDPVPADPESEAEDDNEDDLPTADEPAVKSTITFGSSGDGGLPNEYGGFSAALTQTVEAAEGEEVAVPEMIAATGYHLDYWVDKDGNHIELGDTVKATAEDQTFTAHFTKNKIDIVFKVQNQEGGKLSKVTGLKAVDDYTVTYSGWYNGNSTNVPFPDARKTPGYAEVTFSANTYGSYWLDQDGNRVTRSSLNGPTESAEYTLVFVPVKETNIRIKFVGKDNPDTAIVSAYKSLTLDTPDRLLSSTQLQTLKDSGYVLPEDLEEWTLSYTRANELDLLGADGKLLNTYTKTSASSFPTQTIELEKAELPKVDVTIEASNGYVDGTSRKTITAEEGSLIDLPELKAMDGFEFSKWTDSKGNELVLEDGKYRVAAGDHTIKAVFIGQEMTITWKVSDPNGAVLSVPGGTKYKNLTLNEDGSVTWKARYARNTQVYFPNAAVNPGYQAVGSTTSASHWVHDHGTPGKTFSWRNFDLSPQDNGDVYILNVLPDSFRRFEIRFVDENGTAQYTSTARVDLNTSVDAVSSSALQSLKNKGYRPDDAVKSWKIYYEEANKVELRDAEGNVIDTGTPKPSSTSTMVFKDIPVVRCRFDVVTTINEEVTTTQVDENGTYTLDLSTVTPEGHVVTKVTVDGNEVNPADGRIVIENVTADHAITVETAEPSVPKPTSTVTFGVYGGNGQLKGETTVTAEQGSLIDVPEAVGFEGYELSHWQDSDRNRIVLENGKLRVPENDTRINAVFIGKEITLTWKVSDPEGAVLQLPGKSTDMEVLEDGSIQLKTRYASNKKVYSPTVTVNTDSYYTISQSLSRSHWLKNDGTSPYSMSTSFNLRAADDGTVYTLVPVPFSSLSYGFRFVDAEGNLILETTDSPKCNYQSTDQALRDFHLKALNEKGYTVSDQKLLTAKVSYPKGNLLQILDPEDESKVLYTAEIKGGGSKSRYFTVAAQELPKVDVTIEATNGYVDGTARKTVTAQEGSLIDLPELKAMDGYEFSKWTDSKGNELALENGKYRVAAGDHTIKAVFIGQEMTITWKVSDPNGAVLSVPSGTKYKNLTLNEDGTVTWKARYDRNIKVYFPNAAINKGYAGIETSTSASHWVHDYGTPGKTFSWRDFTLKPADNGDVYTLNVLPARYRNFALAFVNDAGETIYSTSGKINRDEVTELAGSYATKQLASKGYRLSDEAKTWRIYYQEANKVEIRDASGKVLDTAVPKSETSLDLVFRDVQVVRCRFDVVTTVNGEATTAQVDENGTYTLDLSTVTPEDHVVTRVTVDGTEVTPADGKVVIENITADHEITVETAVAVLDLNVSFTHKDTEHHSKTLSLKRNEKTAISSDDDRAALAEKGYDLLASEAKFFLYDKAGHVSVLDAEDNKIADLEKTEEAGITHVLPLKKLYTISHQADDNISIDYETYEDELHQAAVEKGYNAAEGHTHTVKITPKKGYRLDKVSVNGKEESEIKPEGVTLNLIGTGEDLKIEAASVKEKLSFVDVPEDHWSYDSIHEAVNLGLMSGYDEERFGPFDSMSRAMAVTVLWRAAGCPDMGTASFADVPADAWFARAIAWANAAGVVHGYTPDRFGPHDTVTREQFAIMIANYLRSAGINTSVSADLSRFADGNTVHDYARESVEFAVSQGILSGAENGTMLYPHNAVTRAEAAKMAVQAVHLLP